jgi:hypothetical protein
VALHRHVVEIRYSDAAYSDTLGGGQQRSDEFDADLAQQISVRDQRGVREASRDGL